MMGWTAAWTPGVETGVRLFFAPWATAIPERLLPAGFITIVFAGLARAVRGVSHSGALAGAVAAFLLYLCAGPGAFVLLVSVFALTLIATRLGLATKQASGTAEKGEGRSASQVIANLGPATVAAVLFAWRGESAWLAAMVAALAEAAADTASSECGKAASPTARLITNWKRVPAGTDGAVSIAGTLAGIMAALLIAGAAAALRIVSTKWFAVAVAAALFGMMLDSLLGATLERRRVLDNDRVNLLSNVTSLVLALLLAQA